MGFLYSQFFVTPAYPTQSFKDKTVIVTGSNVGLGFEAAKHIARLDAKKVIIAVRNLEAGEEAKKSIETSTKRPGCCEVWKLDLSSYESVKSFAARAQKDLDRLDAVVENAGIATDEFKTFEEHESTITVNVLSTFLLAFLLLPKLQETATKTGSKTNLTIVSSEVHGWSKFPERTSSSILADMSDPKTPTMAERYMSSKLLEVLVIRQIAPLMASGPNKDVTLNMLNPGLCRSSLARSASGLQAIQMGVMKALLARTTEVGGRTLVHSAAAGPESHGKYMSDGIVHDDMVAPWVQSEEGDRVGAQVWKEVKAILEKTQPGVTKNVQ